jgi:hypothetical protein
MIEPSRPQSRGLGVRTHDSQPDKGSGRHRRMSKGPRIAGSLKARAVMLS